MTEERIEELANQKLHELDIENAQFDPDDWGEFRVWAEDLIRDVAAEARNEGIDEITTGVLALLVGGCSTKELFARLKEQK